jgi:tetratricopeptide (TPR) repeat protein
LGFLNFFLQNNFIENRNINNTSMKSLFFVLMLCVSVLAVNAQEVEKSFAELKNEGNAALTNKEFPKALELFEKALVKWGNQPVVDSTMIYNMGYCALSSKNYEKAVKYFDQVIAMNAMKINAMFGKADALKALNNSAESIKTLELASSIAPADAKVTTKLTSAYTSEGNNAIKNKEFPKALEFYEKALAKIGDKPIADTSMIYNMGYCAMSAKNYEKALKYFDQAIALNYKKVNAMVNKADIYRLTKNNVESLKALEAAYAVKADDPKVLSKLASYYVGEANSFYAKGSAVINKVNDQIKAGKLKTTDEPYKLAEKQAAEEFKQALPLAEKALSYDPANAGAKQIKTVCEQAIK